MMIVFLLASCLGKNVQHARAHARPDVMASVKVALCDWSAGLTVRACVYMDARSLEDTMKYDVHTIERIKRAYMYIMNIKQSRKSASKLEKTHLSSILFTGSLITN